jgi:MOSC domain-containing protein YiiM
VAARIQPTQEPGAEAGPDLQYTSEVSPHIVSINTSRGGVPKTSVFEAFIAEDGLTGDAHNNTETHGGPDRAVVLFSLEVIRALQQEGHPIEAGTTGENLTVSGLDWPLVTPGTRLRAGGATLEITKYAGPCVKIAGSFIDGRFMRISHQQHPGWSRLCARVLEAGLVRPGDPIEVMDAK